MLAETGCDGLMLGRGADGNPWLFSRLQAALSGLPVPQEPPLKEKLALALRHLEMLIEYKNESVAVKEMRRHIGAISRVCLKLPNIAAGSIRQKPTPILKNCWQNISRSQRNSAPENG